MSNYEFLVLSKIVAELQLVDAQSEEEKETINAKIAEIDKDLIPLQKKKIKEWREFIERSK